MSSQNDITFKLGAITPISTSDHNADASVREFRPGVRHGAQSGPPG